MGRLWSALRGLIGPARRPGSPALLRPGDGEPFPDPSHFDADGLVAVGGDLSVPRLLDAYRHGIFPWYNAGSPVLWWSPDPRGVIEIDGLHLSRRFRRAMRSSTYTVTFDTAFAAVVSACAEREEGTWILPAMMDAYVALHEAGLAHSVEVWDGLTLVGGVYGVAVGGVFAGESMFSRVSDGSKHALAALFERLRERGFVLFDCQVVNEHTRSLGAVEIPRREYLARLAATLTSSPPPTYGRE